MEDNSHFYNLMKNIGGGVEPPMDPQSLETELNRFGQHYVATHPLNILMTGGAAAAQNPQVRALAEALMGYGGQAVGAVGDAVGGAADAYSDWALGRK